MDELAGQIVNRWHLSQGREYKRWMHLQNFNNTTFNSLWQKWARAVEALQNWKIMQGFTYTVSATVSLTHSIQSFTHKHACTCAHKHVPSLKDVIPYFSAALLSTVRFGNLLVDLGRGLHWALWRLGVWQENPCCPDSLRGSSLEVTMQHWCFFVLCLVSLTGGIFAPYL